MKPFSLVLCTSFALLGNSFKLQLPTFSPNDFPLSTIQNDGTFIARYDVRKTMTFVDSNKKNLNNWYFTLWITTLENRKYHVTSNQGLIGSDTVGAFVSVNDLNNLSGVGGSEWVPGSGNASSVNILSAIQNLTSPECSDNYTNLHLTTNLGGVELDIYMQPTGQNFYYGGSGGFTLPPGQSDDYRTVVPGYTWYWANPTMRLKGFITVGGQKKRDQSRAIIRAF